jgi:hypothetical protein
MEHHNANVINESPAVVTPTAVAPTSGDLTASSLVLPAVKKERKHPFSWDYKVIYEGLVYGKFPFLNDANVKDYIFTKRLCIDTPFFGSKSQQNLK